MAKERMFRVYVAVEAYQRDDATGIEDPEDEVFVEAVEPTLDGYINENLALDAAQTVADEMGRIRGISSLLERMA